MAKEEFEEELNAAPAAAPAAPALAATPAAPAAPTKRPALISVTFIILLACNLVAFAVCQGTNASTSVYLTMKGYTTAMGGISAAVFSLAAVVARVVIGPILDTHGRWPVLFTGMVALLLSVTASIWLNDLVPFMVLRAVQGVGFAASSTAVATAVSDVLPVSRLGEGIGYSGLAQALATAVGPALGLTFVMWNPPEMLFVVFSGFTVVCVLLTFFVRYENKPERLPETSAWRMHYEEHLAERVALRAAKGQPANPSAPKPRITGAHKDDPEKKLSLKELSVLLPTLVVATSIGFSIYFGGWYGTQIGIQNTGLYFVCSAVCMVAARLFGGRFMDSIAPFKLYLFCCICGIVGYVLLICAQWVGPLYYAAGLLYGLYLGFAMPVCQGVGVKSTPARHWGKVNATFLLFNDLGVCGGALIWGFTNDIFGPTVTLVLVMALIVFAIVLAFVLFPGHGLSVLKAKEDAN